MNQAIMEASIHFRGYHYVVFLLSLGYRCGYVGVKKGHRFYQKDCDDIPIFCHGGLTYAGPKLEGLNDKDTWWTGFDCGHPGDGRDIQAVRQDFADDPVANQMMDFFESNGLWCGPGTPIRTLGFVEQQCRDIVRQLRRLESSVPPCIGLGKGEPEQ